MRRLPLVASLVLLFLGCATHHHQVDGDKLMLYLDKPDAQQVILVCSLDDFQPHEAKKENGRWVVCLPSGGQFRYYYVLDGKIFLPSCQMKENDDFGSENCIFDPHL